jgi:outer membrane protein OmpA-like peptidoglycan-associated protein
MALPLLIGQIGKYVGGGGLTAASLQNLLNEQKTFLKDAPAGLSNALGIADLGRAPVVGTYNTERVEAPRPPAGAVATSDRDTPAGGGSWKWAIPLLLLALIPLFFLLRRPEAPRTTVQTPRAEVPTTGTAPVGHLGDFVDRRLPRGVMIRVPAAGVESKLISFIDDRNARLDKETWFSFDRLEFETDSAALKPSSQEQVRNIAEILKAYPNVNVKIGGYTDNVGDDNYNLKLSADRATNTANAISALGVDHARLESEGYGENHPIADNGTEEGRQRNRRIDIRVTKK